MTPESGSGIRALFPEKIATDGSLRVIAGKDAGCGSAVVQMDQDGVLEPWFGLGGNTPTSSEVHGCSN